MAITKTHQRNRDAYIAAPNHCLACGEAILLKEGVRPCIIRRKKFCNQSCAARYNNIHFPKNKVKERDWLAIQSYYDEHGYRKCLRHFGISTYEWLDAKNNGKITYHDHRIPFSEMLVENSTAGRHNLKSRLLNAGMLKNKCYICGISEWLEKPLALDLDHINGINNDNRLENLRLLCPNCHSQTHTYRGRNAKHNSRSAE
jgi:hypothetical protein